MEREMTSKEDEELTRPSLIKIDSSVDDDEDIRTPTRYTTWQTHDKSCKIKVLHQDDIEISAEERPLENAACVYRYTLQLDAVIAPGDVDSIGLGGPQGTEIDTTIGSADNDLADIIECSLMEMRTGETASIRLRESGYAALDVRRFIDVPEYRATSFSEAYVPLLSVELVRFQNPDPVDRMAESALRRTLSAHNERGCILSESGNERRASVRYRRGLALVDEFRRSRGQDAPRLRNQTRKLETALLLNQALCDLNENNFKNAITHCTRALTNDPENVTGLSQRARAFVAEKNLKGAKNDLDLALTKAPDDINIICALKDVTRKMKNRNESSTGGGYNGECLICKAVLQSDEASLRHFKSRHMKVQDLNVSVDNHRRDWADNSPPLLTDESHGAVWTDTVIWHTVSFVVSEQSDHRPPREFYSYMQPPLENAMILTRIVTPVRARVDAQVPSKLVIKYRPHWAVSMEDSLMGGPPDRDIVLDFLRPKTFLTYCISQAFGNSGAGAVLELWIAVIDTPLRLWASKIRLHHDYVSRHDQIRLATVELVSVESRPGPCDMSDGKFHKFIRNLKKSAHKMKGKNPETTICYLTVAMGLLWDKTSHLQRRHRDDHENRIIEQLNFDIQVDIISCKMKLCFHKDVVAHCQQLICRKPTMYLPYLMSIQAHIRLGHIPIARTILNAAMENVHPADRVNFHVVEESLRERNTDIRSQISDLWSFLWQKLSSWFCFFSVFCIFFIIYLIMVDNPHVSK